MEPISIILSIIGALIYVTLYINRYASIIPLRKNYKIFVFIFYLSAIIPLFNFRNDVDFYLTRALIVMIMYSFSILVIFKASLLVKVFLVFNYIIYTLSSFLFFSTFFANFLNIPVDITGINLPIYYNLTYFLSYLVCIVQIFVLDKLVTKEKVSNFLSQKRNLVTFISLQIVLFVNIYLLGSTEVDIGVSLLYNNIVMAISFTISVAYFFLIYSIANISYLNIYKYNTNNLKKQLEIQVLHYKNYETYVISFAKFKHDFDKILDSLNQGSLSTPMINGFLNKSAKELDEINKNYTRYSNNYMMDALLNDFSVKFDSIHVLDKKIDYIHFNDLFDDLDIIKLFYNIFQNAFEAIERLPIGSSRHFSFQSSFVTGFQVVTINNSMKPFKEDLNAKFTLKNDKVLHGIGSSIINEVIEKYGGMINRETICQDDKYTYSIKLYLPYERT